MSHNRYAYVPRDYQLSYESHDVIQAKTLVDWFKITTKASWGYSDPKKIKLIKGTLTSLNEVYWHTKVKDLTQDIMKAPTLVEFLKRLYT